MTEFEMACKLACCGRNKRELARALYYAGWVDVTDHCSDRWPLINKHVVRVLGYTKPEDLNALMAKYFPAKARHYDFKAVWPTVVRD